MRATKYNGPIDSPSFKEQNDCHIFLLRLNGTLTSSAGGVLATVFDAYSQASSVSQWSQLSAIFTEYRILAMKVHALPINKYSVATTNTPIISIVTRDNNTALTSLTDASSYASSKEHVTNSTIDRTVRMDGIDEAQFVSASAAPASGSRLYVKLYATGLAASTNYHQYLNTIVVQFRGFQ